MLKIRIALALIFALCLSALPARADMPLTSGTGADSLPAPLPAMITAYTPWQTAEMSGKLRMEGLPLSPTLKIQMRRGQSIFISIRAPFMGEVGRLEIDGNRITAVNKLRKLYCTEDLAELTGGLMPVTITDVQNILLRRAFMLAYGTLNVDNAPLMTVTRESDCYLLIPYVQLEGDRVRYGFTADWDGTLQALYATSADGDYSALAEYSSKGRRTEIDFSIQKGPRVYGAQLQLDAPVWDEMSPMAPVGISQSWRQVGLGEFIRSLKL